MRIQDPRTLRTIALVIGGSFGVATAMAMAMPGAAPETARCAASAGVVPRASGAEPLVALGTGDILDAIGEGDGTAGTALRLEGVARHASTNPRFGTVFVDDRDGGDALVVGTVGGQLVLPQQGDVFHPVWSPLGDLAWSSGTSIHIRDRAAGRTATLQAPSSAVSITYPLFVGATRLVASVEEPVEGLSSEFEGLNNLWSVDLQSGRWKKLTFFTATAERWSVIRTPILADRGQLLFVRVHGYASRTRPPTFELWRLRDGSASLVRELGGEMYLAGLTDGRLVWNVADARGRWHLLRAEASGRLRDLGCGRVSVDPLTRPDPDLAPTGETGRTTGPPPTTSPTVSPTVPPAAELAEGLGILVGDFATREAAEAAAGVIAIRFGILPTVIDASTHPTLIRPGAFAAVVPLADGVDPELELQRFRDLLPQTRTTSWIVALP